MRLLAYDEISQREFGNWTMGQVKAAGFLYDSSLMASDDAYEILLDGTPIDTLALQDLRGRIGIVPQDPVIFSSSALENIRYGRPEASDDEVRAAAHAAFADEFIARLPEG